MRHTLIVDISHILGELREAVPEWVEYVKMNPDIEPQLIAAYYTDYIMHSKFNSMQFLLANAPAVLAEDVFSYLQENTYLYFDRVSAGYGPELDKKMAKLGLEDDRYRLVLLEPHGPNAISAVFDDQLREDEEE